MLFAAFWCNFLKFSTVMPTPKADRKEPPDTQDIQSTQYIFRNIHWLHWYISTKVNIPPMDSIVKEAEMLRASNI